MIIARRLFASAIDVFLYLLVFLFINPYIANFIDPSDSIESMIIGDRVVFISFLFYFILMEPIFCTSPGKWVLNFRIISYRSSPYDRFKILLRSILKALTMISLIGIIINIIGLAVNNHSWYDPLLGLDVEDTRGR